MSQKLSAITPLVVGCNKLYNEISKENGEFIVRSECCFEPTSSCTRDRCSGSDHHGWGGFSESFKNPEEAIAFAEEEFARNGLPIYAPGYGYPFKLSDIRPYFSQDLFFRGYSCVAIVNNGGLYHVGRFPIDLVLSKDGWPHLLELCDWEQSTRNLNKASNKVNSFLTKETLVFHVNESTVTELGVFWVSKTGDAYWVVRNTVSSVRDCLSR